MLSLKTEQCRIALKKTITCYPKGVEYKIKIEVLISGDWLEARVNILLRLNELSNISCFFCVCVSKSLPVI